MIEIAVGKHNLQLYHAAEELPVKRYSRFQKYNLVESGIGADIESIGVHFAKLFEFIGFKLHDEALQETKNLYYTFHLMLEEINVPGLAFCCLVHSIDGEELTDLSEDHLKKVVETLSGWGLSQKIVLQTNDEVKKKVHSELKRYCPSYFNDEESFQFYQQVKAKIAVLGRINAEGETPDLLLRLKAADRYFAEYAAPLCFDTESEENAVLKAETTFEVLCSVLESNGVINAGNLTALQFYSRLDYFRKLKEPAKPA